MTTDHPGVPDAAPATPAPPGWVDLDQDPSGGDVAVADTFEPLPGTPAAALLAAEREAGR